jgi:hypothetical protein
VDHDFTEIGLRNKGKLYLMSLHKCFPYIYCSAIAIFSACLLALSACRGSGIRVMPISIVTKDITGAPVTLTTEVTRIQDSGGCEYRLEFKDPSSIEWPIGEVSGKESFAVARTRSLSPADRPGVQTERSM